MAIHFRRILAVLLLPGAVALAQQTTPASAPATIVQPGAPGQDARTLSAETVRTPARTPVATDISFMQGMIHHHAQAVEMVELLRTRGRSKALRALGERIAISQTDEIKFMKQWLDDRGAASSMGSGPMDQMHHMPRMAGMDHLDSMSAMPPMPGMLTPEQMKALAAAKGAQFDHLFLTGMIQHHTGALTMVNDLFSNLAAGQDPVLFDFATDITNTQTAEIKIMQAMLQEETK